MYIYELNNLIFFIKSLQFPTANLTLVSTSHLLAAILDPETTKSYYTPEQYLLHTTIFTSIVLLDFGTIYQ